LHGAIAGAIAATAAHAATAQIPPATPASPPPPSYADLADLADSAAIVARAQVRSLVRVKDAQAPGLRPGQGRFFVKAKTRALITGTTSLGEGLRYLVDLPLDTKGKPPKLAKTEVLLFARPVPGRSGELQLVAPDAQLAWSAPVEARLRTILSDLLAPGAPGRVSGVREALYVPGSLAGEGETQIFLTTRDGSAASITVRHSPGAPPAWGVSFSELVAEPGRTPVAGTLVWYRLACFLPNRLPRTAEVSDSAEARAQAQADYRTVLGSLGPCERTRL